MRFRVVFAGLLVPILLVLLVHSAAVGKGVTFERYQALSEEDRQKLVKRYVKEADGCWNVSVGNYLVRSDISGEKALATAVKMDQFLRRFTKIFKGSFKTKVKPELYVMKTKSSYLNSVQQWSRGSMSAPNWSVGLFARIGRRFALFGCAESGDGQLYNTLFHEGTHQLMYFYVGRSCDIWFDEGVATNFETWDVSLSADRNISEEIWKSRHPRVLYEMLTGSNKAGGRCWT